MYFNVAKKHENSPSQKLNLINTSTMSVGIKRAFQLTTHFKISDIRHSVRWNAQPSGSNLTIPLRNNQHR